MGGSRCCIPPAPLPTSSFWTLLKLFGKKLFSCPNANQEWRVGRCSVGSLACRVHRRFGASTSSSFVFSKENSSFSGRSKRWCKSMLRLSTAARLACSRREFLTGKEKEKVRKKHGLGDACFVQQGSDCRSGARRNYQVESCRGAVLFTPPLDVQTQL